MKVCKNCKNWNKLKIFPDEGVCIKLKKHISFAFTNYGYANTIYTKEDFGCKLFEKISNNITESI